MAGKFVELADAAAAIGVTPEELIEMRSRGDIFGYRDGGSWKFKQEEVERVISERAGGGGSGISLGDDLQLDDLASGFTIDTNSQEMSPVGDAGGDSEESILISDELLGGPETKKQSTIIGKPGSGDAGMDSDIKLVVEPEDVHSGSDLKLSGSGTNPLLGPATGSGSGTGEGSGLMLEGGSDLDLQLGDDDDGEISLGSDKPVAGGSAIGSDITLGASDSGINLAPTDSGLSLEEEPLDLGGSAVESLELPEDEDVISLEDEAADPDQATQLKADDQFLLSPGDAMVDDESDSGSQVIALEDSEGFDQDAATMLGAGDAGLLTEDAFAAMPVDALGAAAIGTQATAMPGMTGGAVSQPVYVQVPVVEAPYSIWNVLSLSLVTLLLALCGMLMVDVMLNMWAFDGAGSLSTAVMDGVISMFGLDQ